MLEKTQDITQFVREFPQKRNLEIHVRTHSWEKPYQCINCDHTRPIAEVDRENVVLISDPITHSTQETLLNEGRGENNIPQAID